jgi:hypothetical protein
MRGCLRKAERKTRYGMKPGEYAWNLIVPIGKRPNAQGKLVHRQQWIRFIGTSIGFHHDNLRRTPSPTELVAGPVNPLPRLRPAPARRPSLAF